MKGHLLLGRALIELSCLELQGAPDIDREGAAQRLAQVAACVDQHDPPALLEALRLSPGERLVLAVLGAIALDVDAARVAGALCPGGFPTLTLLRGIVYRGCLEAAGVRELAARGTLRRLRLIEPVDGGSGGVHESKLGWCIAPRLLALWSGADELDPELSAWARLVTPEPRGVAPASDPDLVARVRAAAGQPGALVVIAGRPGHGRRGLIAEAMVDQGRRLLEIDARGLASEPRELERQLRAAARECALIGGSPVVCDADALACERDGIRAGLVARELVAAIDGPVFATCGPSWPAARWGRSPAVIDVACPSWEQRARLWGDALGQGTVEDAAHLATHFPLAPSRIRDAAAAARASAAGRPMRPEDLHAGIRSVLDERLGEYARRVEVTQTWDDLVLADDQREAIRYLVARVRQRRTVYEQWGFAAKVGKGLGTSALFSGPPGTGKTMVAALIARELGLELYQVDMARVTSKYLGETERNLGAVFDAAEAGCALLLFDEADALFGKRTEVRSSNDRHANHETNYLLQRLESFTGICLLTTNHASHMDPAFERRLSLHLRFALPDVAEREALWRAMLPASAPVAAELDTASLARRFVMSGGYIRNAALRAAFLAADDGAEITAAHLEEAARMEYEGMGKLAA